MAVRIRRNGQIFCAAHSEPLDGDCYLDDGIHYILAVERKVLVTDDEHSIHWQWWWVGQMPESEDGKCQR